MAKGQGGRNDGLIAHTCTGGGKPLVMGDRVTRIGVIGLQAIQRDGREGRTAFNGACGSAGNRFGRRRLGRMPLVDPRALWDQGRLARSLERGRQWLHLEPTDRCTGIGTPRDPQDLPILPQRGH